MMNVKQIVALLAAAVLLTACGGSKKSNKSLDGAGATFPLPFYNLVFKKYHNESGVAVNYGAQGSGAGINSLKNKVVDFAGSDAYLTDEEMKEMPGEVIHIPTCIGAVVVAYNLPEVKDLQLSGEVIADIYMGKIKQWNDKAIADLNPTQKLPDQAITVVYRSDGSGTTNVFSNYLSKVSAAWRDSIGSGKSLNWPVGMAAKGNPGVSGVVQQTKGAIGYIGSEYSFFGNLPAARIRNSSGAFITASTESISAAAEGNNIPADSRIMITNSSNPNAYPISCLTWLLIYKEQSYANRSEEQARETVALMKWMLSDDTQHEATKVHYSPLPKSMQENALKSLEGVTYNGKPIAQ